MLFLDLEGELRKASTLIYAFTKTSIGVQQLAAEGDFGVAGQRALVISAMDAVRAVSFVLFK